MVNVYKLNDSLDLIVNAIDDDKKKICCIFFCDLSKAFDRVWRKGLLFQLQSNAINGNLLQCFKSLRLSEF